MTDDAAEQSVSAAPAKVAKVDQIVAEIRTRILAGRFAEGQRLIEADMVRELGTSRGSLREALSRLSAEGRVELVPNKGAIVRRFPREQILALYQIRIRLEPLSAELAARFINQGTNRRDFLAVLEWLDAQDTGSIEAWRQANFRFHRTVTMISGNRKIGPILEQLWVPSTASGIRDALGLTDWRESEADHRAIAQAILAGDTAAASELMASHLRRGAERMLAYE